jgi:LPS export ABC transporter protein LptC
VITARGLRFKAGAGRVLLARLVASAAAGVFWSRSLPPDADAPAPGGPPTGDRRAEMVTRDFRHVETRLNRTIWILESAQAEIIDETARLKTVKVTWYGEEGSLPVVITSTEGQVDFRKRNAALAGSVRLERADGAVLVTERLLWDDGRKHLRAPLPVVITTPSFTFRGQRLDANLETEQFLLHGGVRGEIRVGAVAPTRPS